MSLSTSARQDLLEAPRILLLDGGYGSQFRALDLPEEAFHPADAPTPTQPLKGNYELLNLSRPEIVRSLHDAYLEAGADIIETNTFNANPLIQADWGAAVLAQDMAFAGAALARAAADAAMRADPSHPRLVAGALGVTRRNPARQGADSPPGLRDVEEARLLAACRAQAEALIEGGVDLLLIETVTTLDNARLALAATQEGVRANGSDVPIVLSLTVDREGRLESGETLEVAVEALDQAGLYALGLNCALDGRALKGPIATLAGRSKSRIWLYPNAGYPDAAGHYHEPPAETASVLAAIARAGQVDALGGCCGTTPEHIRALAEAVRGLTPRQAR